VIRNLDLIVSTDETVSVGNANAHNVTQHIHENIIIPLPIVDTFMACISITKLPKRATYVNLFSLFRTRNYIYQNKLRFDRLGFPILPRISILRAIILLLSVRVLFVEW